MNSVLIDRKVAKKIDSIFEHKKLLSVLRYAIPPPYAMGEAKQKRFLSSPQN